jgi:CSLREA domain-containing protein
MSLLVAAMLAAVGVALGPASGALAAGPYVVNSTNDEFDNSVGDGVCATSLGECTLRAAIQEANFAGDPDEIQFHIAGSGLRTITVGSNLPTITQVTTIDGWSQGVFDGTPDYKGPPLIAIVPSFAKCCNGLEIQVAPGTIKGIAIGGFNNAINLNGGSGHTVVGSYLGVLPDLAVANGTTLKANDVGILVKGSVNDTIGGTGLGEGNVIAGNAVAGINIPPSGSAFIYGNLIGTDRRGTTGIGNKNGVRMVTSGGLIGDGTATGRNIIAGNTENGLLLSTGSISSLTGNYIGVGPDGSTGIANNVGIKVDTVSAVNIGGTTAGDRNVVSGNTENQISLTGVCGCSVLLTGNYIGPNAAGTAAVANTATGIRITDASDVIIGGVLPGEGNLISGNGQDGISIVGQAAQDIKVGGNWIGLNAAGTAALPNLGNGISLLPGAGGNGPHATEIGDETPGTSNVISGNGRHGIRILKTREDTSIVHNVIGTDPTGSIAIPNGGDGILIEQANRLTIRENTIANNLQAGVVMMPRTIPAVVGNVLFGNSIFSNMGPGIDLTDTVDPNGVGDGTVPGPPGAQGYPEVVAATTSAVGTIIAGTLTSDPNLSYRVEVFGSPSCDPSGKGEGRAFLGGIDVGTNGAGSATFVMTVPSLPIGQVITATATNLDHQTSEFSACKEVTTAAIVVSPTSGLSTTEAGGTATFTVKLSTVPTANVTIGLSSNNPLEGTVSPPSLTFTPANATTAQTVTVTGAADTTADGNQNYSIVTAAATSTDPAYNGLNPADVAVVNLDAGAVPTLSVAPAEVIEGTGAAVAMTFTVTLSPASTQTIVVPWSTQNGTAQAGSDFVETAGSVTFAPGDTSKSISIQVIGDNQVEGNEAFVLQVGPVTNAAIGTRTAIGTIKDDDMPISACSPNRPNIGVNVRRSGTEQMLVTIEAGTGTIQKVSFGTAARPTQNATVSLIGSSNTVTDQSSFAPPAGTTRMTFLIRRTTPGQAVTIPMTVEDGCGPWDTFVGGGNGAF